jgi:hypothetical protein
METRVWSGELLSSLREVGDPFTDGLIEQTYAEGGWEAIIKLNRFLQTWQAPVTDDIVPGIRKFLEEPVEYPAWVNLDQLHEAYNLFYRHPLEVLLVLFLRSFPQFLADADAAQVFYRMDIFKPQTIKRFTFEMIQIIFDILRPGGLFPPPANGEGITALKKLRLHHSVIRFQLHNEPKLQPWDPAWGVPINQEDLACSLLAFSLWDLDGLKKLHISLAAREQEATLLLWNVIGYLLGLRDELRPVNLEEATELLRQIGLRQFRPSKAATTLVRQLLGVASDMLPWCFKGVPLILMRFLMDPFFIKLLKVPRAFGPTRWVLAIFKLLWGSRTAARRTSRKAGQYFVQSLERETGRQAKRGPLRMPPEVRAKVEDTSATG